MKVHYQDDMVTLYHGDALAVLETMDSGSVDCIVTSPPYFGLRDYGVDGQIGAEPSPAEFVDTLVAVFREARRVLADDGTLWLNLGDTYSAGCGTKTNGPQQSRNGRQGVVGSRDKHPSAGRAAFTKTFASMPPAKNLLGIPWRVAFALQDDGWILRNDIIWHKPNAMPESVTDRLSNRHEHLFMFSKKPRYWFDLDTIREPAGDYVGRTWEERKAAGGGMSSNRGVNTTANPVDTVLAAHPAGKNPGDVWRIPTQPFPGAHFAAFPPDLPERCIQAGCRPGGTVLDPFNGSGTTGMAAAKHGRKYVGIDLNDEYLDLSLKTRLRQPGLDLWSVS